MGFSKRVRSLVAAAAVITPFVLSLGSASAHVAAAHHAAEQPKQATACQGTVGDEDVQVLIQGDNVFCGGAAQDD